MMGRCVRPACLALLGNCGGVACGRRPLARVLLAIVIAAGWLGSAAAEPPPPRVAVFDFELMDTSLEGEKRGPQADEQARLGAVAQQIRNGLAASERFVVVDVAPVRAAAARANLQACGGCDVDLAATLGADLAITGVVHKVSTLILGMQIFVRDVRSGRLLAAINADFRGNTDESWSRTASYLLRNRLLAPDYGVQR